MCGIIGTCGFSSGNDVSAFVSHMLYVDTIRGADSTGLAAITNKYVEIVKDTIPGYHFINNPQYKKLLGKGATLYLGHNRAATSGQIVPWTAHPFRHDNITLVHNGTLQYWTGLSKVTATTDSEAICMMLSELKDNTVENQCAALERINGAYALVWHDSSDNTVHFARNDARPMWIGWIEKQTRFVFSSDPSILEFGCAKAGWDIESMDELPPGEHWTITMDYKGLQKGFEYVSFTPHKPEPVHKIWHQQYFPKDSMKSNSKSNTKSVVKYPKDIIEVVIKPAEVIRLLNKGDQNGSLNIDIPSLKEAGNVRTWFLKEAALRDILASVKDGKKMYATIDSVDQSYGSNTIWIRTIYDEDDVVEGFQGKLIPVEEFYEKTEAGCSLCAKQLDHSNTEWLDANTVVCNNCAEDLSGSTYAEYEEVKGATIQ